MPAPEQSILAKTPVPMPWGSDEIRARYAAQIRERAFFSARTIQMDYVRRLQEVCAEYAAGRINAADARTGLQTVLDELGLSDRSGALTDLGSARRLNLILRTQRQMAASAARLAEQTPDVLDAWPAWRLTRMGTRAVPRDDWPQRWHAAGERVGWRGAHRSQMVALKGSPIWQALGDGAGGFRDAIGNPYPPFAFGSGLDWMDVSREEALRLGLEPDGQAPEQANLAPSDIEIAEAVAKTGMGPEFFRPRPTFNRAARRAAALLITALAVKAIRNRNCTDCGAFVTKDGKCNNPDHTTGDEPAKAEAKEDSKQSTAPKQGGGKKTSGSLHAGYKGKCDRQEAIDVLSRGLNIRDEEGRPVHFDRSVRDHYLRGFRRKDNEPKPENLELLPVAVFAIRHGSRTIKFPRGTTPDYLDPPRGTQAIYSTPFNNGVLRAYVYVDTGLVSGWHVREGAKK